MMVEKIEQLITPALHALGLALWSFDWVAQKNSALLRIYIDRLDKQPVSLEDCTKASREISTLLDIEDMIKTRYHLEISSPGLNRALHTLPQYQQFVGSELHIKLRHAQNDQKNWIGKLDRVQDEQIFLTLEDGTAWHVAFRDIQKANVVSH